MALKVKCECGKAYQVPDEAAGKRVTCTACGQVLFVPEPPTQDFPTGAAGTCPKCGAGLRAGAEFCTACGTNLSTGTPHHTAKPAVRPGASKHRAIVLPWGRIIGAAVVVGVIAGAWFGLLRPMRARSAIDDAMKPVEGAKYRTALEMLRAAGPKLYGAYAEEADFRIAQIEMETKYGLRSSSPEGESIRMDAVPEVAKSGALLLHLTVVNAGDQPLLLRKRAFYLASNAGMVPSTDHRESSIEGVPVAPGGTGEGVVAFRKIPGSPLGLISSEIVKPQKLVYNDGTRYSSTLVILMGAGSGPPGANMPLP